MILIQISCFFKIFHIFLSSEVLKEAGKLCPKMLAAEIEGVKHKHRTKKYCDELLKVITSFS